MLIRTHQRGVALSLLLASTSSILGCGSTPDSANPAPSTPPTETPPTETPSTETPPPPPPGAFLAQLQPAVNADLLALDIPIAIPTYLPPGFDLAAYDVGTRADGADAGPYYALVYHNAESQCFAIEASSGGVGSPILENRFPIESPIFGSNAVLYSGQLKALNAPATAATPDLVSDWLPGEVARYRYIGARLTMATYEQPACTDVPAEEAVKIIESLAYLTSDIYGDYGEAPVPESEAPTAPVLPPAD